MDRKEMAEFIPYTLSRGCPPIAEVRENAGVAPEFAFSIRFPVS
jgi:hypothetical protein